MRTVSVEKRHRGPFGWAIAILFWGFNAIMVAGLWAFATRMSAGPAATSHAEHVGAVIGGTIAFSAILWIWALGDFVLGVAMLLTRGKKVTVTAPIQAAPAPVYMPPLLTEQLLAPLLLTERLPTTPAESRHACPFCAEQILVTAKLCRFCNRDLPPGWAATNPNTAVINRS